MLIRSARRTASQGCCAIAVMAKESSPGRTKTRLAPPLTLAQAARLNTVFLGDVADNVSLAAEQTDIACYMAFGPPSAVPFFETHLSADLGLIEAWLPNFGDCLWQTAKSLFDMGYGAVCLLNSDSPTLPTQVLIDTARSLKAPGERVVVGPSLDGGYYLLGMQHPHRRLFEGIDWSTSQVMRQTSDRIHELGLDELRLPAWYDVDDAESLQLLARETLAGERFSDCIPSYPAPRTTAALQDIWS